LDVAGGRSAASLQIVCLRLVRAAARRIEATVIKFTRWPMAKG
jgi:hypothetical protein